MSAMSAMSADARDRILRVADLIDRPGVSRRVDLAVPASADLELDMATLEGDIRLTGVLESVVDGILLRGTLVAELQMACARCLADLEQVVAADVVELFSTPSEDSDDIDPGYEIVDTTIDLDTLTRDALVPAVPYRPLCAEDCKGLCVQCGTNRNETECSCEDSIVDARWAALEKLQLGDCDTP
ncbi:MAG: DUF177 domain-containing protein [Nitriliruptorales bacterium]|nr:DUF177 domain-containing protein [Nitriliruptorales bacterium]